KHVRVLVGEVPEDPHHLLRRLPGAEHGLGSADPEGSMGVELGEAQILVREATQAGERRVGSEGPRLHGGEQGPEALDVHRGLSGAYPAEPRGAVPASPTRRARRRSRASFRLPERNPRRSTVTWRNPSSPSRSAIASARPSSQSLAISPRAISR